MSLPFSKIPSTTCIAPTPFRASIPQKQVSELQTLVALSKIASPTYESVQSDRRFGITTDWLASMKEKWVNDFDWRACEDRINSFPQFTVVVEDIKVHFVALFSENEDAVPIVFLHGWPGN
ncbi:epoxide hydrolase [Aspergillus sp. HF37]|nr:epoxide hydrolase [Aspergillus sp. HF37]